MDTNVIKWTAVVMTVAIGALTALVGTHALTGTAAVVVGGLLAVLNAALGYVSNQTMKARLTAASKRGYVGPS